MNKPNVKLRAILSLFRIFKYLQKKNHDLTYFFWESTLRCNLSCIHCGSDCRIESQTPDMPAADFMKVLDRVATQYDPKTILIAITGGEPLVRKDLEDIGREISRKGFYWGMVSNGYALDQKRITSLLNAGLATITISLDGLEANHNWMRARHDSFKRALDGITLLASTRKIRQFAFDVVTCVNERNFDELPQLRDLLISIGVKEWRLFTIFPKGRAEGNKELLISDEKMAGIMDFIVQTKSEGHINISFSCEGYIGNYENKARKGYFFCRAGINVGSVLANGDISACPSLRGDFIQGNIYRDDFLDVWNTRFSNMRDRRWLKSGECSNCSEFPYCEGNGLHLRDEASGKLLRCHHSMISDGKRSFKV